MIRFVHRKPKASTSGLPTNPTCNSNQVRAQNAATPYPLRIMPAGAQLSNNGLSPNVGVRLDRDAPHSGIGDSARETSSFVEARRLP